MLKIFASQKNIEHGFDGLNGLTRIFSIGAITKIFVLKSVLIRAIRGKQNIIYEQRLPTIRRPR